MMRREPAHGDRQIAATPGASGAQCVVQHAFVERALNCVSNLILLPNGQSAIHQSVERESQQPEPSSQDIECDQDADDRIEPFHPGDIHQDQPDNDP